MRNYVHFFKFKLLNYKKKLWTLGLNKCPTHRMELAGPKIQIIRFFFFRQTFDFCDSWIGAWLTHYHPYPLVNLYV